MQLSGRLKSACDAFESYVHAEGESGRADRYVSLAELAPPAPPARRPAMRRSTTHTHELRALLAHRLREAEASAAEVRERAEAQVVRWALRAAWWWVRRRAGSWFER